MQPYRQAQKAEALATTRFEAPPGRQLQIDFGARLVEIGGAKQEHWFPGLESALTSFGWVPEEVLMDNPRARRAHDAKSRSVQFNDKLIAFAKHWGTVAAIATFRTLWIRSESWRAPGNSQPRDPSRRAPPRKRSRPAGQAAP